MKKRILIIITIILLILASIFVTKRKEDLLFLYWTDVYIAAPVESEYTIAVSLFSFRQKIDFSEIDSIELADTPEITVESFDSYELEGNKEFQSKGINLNLKFNKKGIMNPNYLIICKKDGSKKILPIGNWIFEIEDSEKESVVMEDLSPAASSSSKKFVYDYKLKDTVSSVKIKSGKDKINPLQLKQSEVKGEIMLNSKAPMMIIRPMLSCTEKDKTELYYGISCYCGALDVTKDKIEKSYQYALEHQK